MSEQELSNKMILIMKRIKSRRIELNISYQKLADETGLSKSTLQRYETGAIKNMPLDKLENVAKALNTSPAYLMGWEENISSGTGFSLSDLEKQIVLSYRNADDVGKAIVLRSLGIEASKGGSEKMA